jgi:hypothetical protein
MFPPAETTMRLASLVVVTIAGMLAVRLQPPAVPYPEGFREWAHVKSGLVGPQSARFAGLGGLHHVYANPAARRALADGQWKDGAIIVLDRFEAVEANGDTKEGKRLSLDVMVRDSARYAATGGWGFDRFAGDTRNGTVGASAGKACFNCHAEQGNQRMVFTSWRP